MIRSFLHWFASALLIVIAFWNIWSFDRNAANLRNFGVLKHEARYARLQETLRAAGYRSGNIGFITNRDLKSEHNTAEDDERWSQAQFALVPWIVLRGTRSVSGYAAKTTPALVIGDFWDGPPVEVPPGLVKIYESGDGLILFKRKSSE
jgi:hypothetical protein